jgi:hypothetical protein
MDRDVIVGGLVAGPFGCILSVKNVIQITAHRMNFCYFNTDEDSVSRRLEYPFPWAEPGGAGD